ADCGTAGTCNQATGSCYESGCSPACGSGETCVGGVCLTGPTLTLVPATPPTRAVPDQAGDRWHRDEVVDVSVSSGAALDAGSVWAWVSGIALDGGVSDWVDAGPVEAGTGCSAGYCGVAHVAMWLPAFEAYEGDVHVRVTGVDPTGAQGEASVDVAIT